jgi:hypothetical protein
MIRECEQLAKMLTVAPTLPLNYPVVLFSYRLAIVKKKEFRRGPTVSKYPK